MKRTPHSVRLIVSPFILHPAALILPSLRPRRHFSDGDCGATSGTGRGLFGLEGATSGIGFAGAISGTGFAGATSGMGLEGATSVIGLAGATSGIGREVRSGATSVMGREGATSVTG
jgi:hypothetical protein